MLMMLLSSASFAQHSTAYSKDKKELYKVNVENVNGCKKATSRKCYDAKTREIKWEWNKRFSTDANQTCDFSAYVITRKKYKKGKLSELTQHFAGSEQSTEEPCGNWKYYTPNGKLLASKNYGKCDINKFRKN